MKKINFIISVFVLFYTISLKAQNPAYTLESQGFELNCGTYTSLEWDIYIRSLDPSNPIEYASGQYIFRFDATIANGGELSFEVIGSDLPVNLRPVNPLVVGPYLLLGSNYPPPPPGQGYIINSFPSVTKIARVRLSTTSTSFSGNSFYPEWVNKPPPVYTKIYANVNGAYTDITDTTYHQIIPVNCGMFTDSPWECCGAKLLSLKAVTEGLYNTSTNNLNRKDTVTVELRREVYPYDLLYSTKCRLDSIDLSGFYPFTIMLFPMPDFFLAVKHHNSIETWGKVPVGFLRNGHITAYDLTASDTSAFGNNLNLKGNKFCIYSGDVNQDKLIDLTDVMTIYNDSRDFLTGYVNTDLNGDNFVNQTDLIIAYNNSANFVRAVTPLN